MPERGAADAPAPADAGAAEAGAAAAAAGLAAAAAGFCGACAGASLPSAGLLRRMRNFLALGFVVIELFRFFQSVKHVQLPLQQDGS